MKKRFLLFIFALQTVLLSIAQLSEQPDKNLVYKGQQLQLMDTTCLLHAFKNGQFSGHLRYFFMSTQNENNLTDFYSNAIGGGIRYETARFHNFQFALSDFTIFNIGSSDFTRPDSLTGQYSRYEIGHFDINNPGNTKELNRLEELYLKYNFNHSYIKAGRQYINSTFINLQDGRMSPTTVSGIWAEVNEIKKLKIQVGWLWGISPRSTTTWYQPGKSIGVYPVGVNANGAKSGYANNVESSGIGIIQLHTALSKKVKLLVADMFVENVFNATMLQIDFNLPLKENSVLFAALQTIKEFAVNDGGNVDQSKTYFLKGSQAFTFGARLGWKNEQWEASLNYNRITKNGRYLAPREWGIDPFFTFLPRERNDGFGNANAIMGKVNYTLSGLGLKTSLAAGYYDLAEVKNYTFNKYGMPRYIQLNADIRYVFKNTFKGLEAQFLLVEKINKGNTYSNSKYIINKVNMQLYNVILNYHF
ncbi:MAG: OprD family outer membrane porin [Ferruginibacter sp.]